MGIGTPNRVLALAKSGMQISSDSWFIKCYLPTYTCSFTFDTLHGFSPFITIALYK